MTDSSRAEASPSTTYLKDYQPPAWLVETVDLQFMLADSVTQVISTLKLRKNPGAPAQPLKLDGESLKPTSVTLNGELLDNHQYQLEEDSLTIEDVPDGSTLTTIVELDPASNTTLMGLYQSSGNYCTQCEAEGFRKITFFPDRPDVLSVYTVMIVADKKKYPILLSNGNPQDAGDTPPDQQGNARHFAVWHDPHPKPSYLFALVAGDLARIHDEYTTMSGRKVDLNIYVEHHNADKCEHAMRSIINSMRWDEQAYGREYDLDVFNVVAVDDFNMGAMENKGLNVFNSKYVLARADTATDTDFQGIEGVIGHEYFHNWSGNRVTCRDWFQLSLKEGFTVFRDQEFSADMSARGIKRIQDVNMLRTHQFREDAGPMAHPIRPDQYVEINNFYTLTVYEKGAEVVRMLCNLLGPEDFRKGTDLYFSRHDGQAVTTDDFVQALEDASGYDLQQFRLWYSTAGTPELTVSEQYDADNNRFTLNISQHTPDTPGQKNKSPLHIPLRMGLLDQYGDSLPLTLAGEAASEQTTRVLHLRKQAESFTFDNIYAKPVASLLRGFSAPVKVNMERSVEELCFLMANDTDEFNRWDAAQTLATQLMVAQLDNDTVVVDPAFINAVKETLLNDSLKPALTAEILRLPAEGLLADQRAHAQPDRIHHVRKTFRRAIASELQADLLQRYHALTQTGAYSIEPDAMGQRALRNQCLGYLMSPARPDIEDEIFNLCVSQYEVSDNMTDCIAALACLCNIDDPARVTALDDFYTKWQSDTLVIDKWFALQATSELPGTLDHVRTLTAHEAFNIKNPNKVRSLIGAFANANPLHFHAINGDGYQFVARYVIELDKLNPQIASRLVNVFSRWQQYDDNRQALMKDALDSILNAGDLSKDVYEIVSKSLG
ncbi:MAG: aminopeptidase N [Gammaproteobacteria bacterium]|nr:aminopeptidase N [Gammaproteobacteria bacterium]